MAEGGNRLWLHARMMLHRDDATYATFQQMYQASCHPDDAREWWVSESVPDLLARYEVVPVEVDTDPGFNLESGSSTLTPLRTDLRQPGDEDEEGNELPHEVPSKHAAHLTVRQLGFALHKEGCAALPTSYPGQCLVKVDPINDYLVYDIAEATPILEAFYEWPIDKEEARQCIKDFERRPSPGGEAEDEDEAELEEEDLFLENGQDRMNYFFMNSFNFFRESRIMRTRLDLNHVCSLIFLAEPFSYGPGDAVQFLHKGKWLKGAVTATAMPGTILEVAYSVEEADGSVRKETTTTMPQYLRPVDKSRLGILVIDLLEPAESFATRSVHSKVSEFNKFELMGDWTPETAASESLRHYIHADCEEIRQILIELFHQREDLKDHVRVPMKKPGHADWGQAELAQLLPEHAPQPDVRPPHLRRMPAFGKIEGLDGAHATQGPSVTAGQCSELAHILEQQVKDQLADERDEAEERLGLKEDPNFQFPKHMGQADPVLQAAQDMLAGRQAVKASYDPLAKLAEQPGTGWVPQRPEPAPEPEPAAPPAPTAQLCPPGLSSTSWSCGKCKKSGLLAWVRRCPSCGIALAPKTLSAMSKSAAKPAAGAAAEDDQDIPDKWDD